MGRLRRWIVAGGLLACLVATLVAAGQVPPAAGRPRQERLRRAMAERRFVAYTPSELNPLPEHFRPATAESIRAELKRLRPWFSGLVTYSVARDQGLDQVVGLAAEAGYVVVIGVWDVRSVQELWTAIHLAQEYPDTVVGVIVGNETQVFGRATMEELVAAIELVRAALPDMPVTTSEVISSYGGEVRELGDFLAPTAHWIFNGGDPGDIPGAVAWLKQRAAGLRELAPDRPLLIKESGVPSDPHPFTPENQALYWRLVTEQMPSSEAVAVCAFEAVDCPFKSATNPGEHGEAESHWGFFSPWPELRAKPVLSNLAPLPGRGLQ